MEDMISRIANLEYDLFVANPHAIAIQQNDGRYITKYIHYDSNLLETMIKLMVPQGVTNNRMVMVK